MSSRYLSNLAIIVAAGFLVVVTQAFAAPAVAWLTFGIAMGVTAVSLYMVASAKGITQLAIGGVGAALGAWTIVASLVFAPTTVLWLGFASAIAYVGLGLIGLTIHELTTERVVHSLGVTDDRRAQEPVDGREAVTA
jgi:hypothetical protein